MLAKVLRKQIDGFVLFLCLSLMVYHTAMSALSDGVGSEVFSFIRGETSEESAADESSDDESAVDEGAADAGAAEDGAHNEGETEDGDSEGDIPEESASDEGGPDDVREIDPEKIVPKEGPQSEEEGPQSDEITVPDVPRNEEEPSLDAKDISGPIDLTNQQDGEGYSFQNNLLTIHQTGIYQLTGGTESVPLSVRIRIESDATVDLSDVSISSDGALALVPDIEVSLLISGRNNLTSSKEAGISVPKGAVLTIDGGGDLIVQGGIGAVFSNPLGCAGIGSGVNMAGGTVIIAGGNISAYGGNYTQGGGAGIGTGGSRGSGNIATLESIEIRGGMVFAQGGESAAGIGTGVGRNSGTTTIDTILLSNGSITCNAGDFGAEIGTGEAFSSGMTSIGTISITGGSVNATFAAEGGAAIGTGEAYNSSSNTIGLIQITGGHITVAGGPQGAGIGAGRGYNSNSVSRVERLEIKGGIIDAQGGTGGAGIGAGLAQNNGGVSSVGEIIIDQGTLELRGGLSASGIGSGQGHSRGVSSVESIVINGGNIVVSNDIEGFDGGAALGSGEGSNNGQSTVGDVTIRDGTIHATAGKGAAAIGAGQAFSSGISRVNSVNIHGGTILRALGGPNGAGIGAGLTTNSSGTSTVGSINISGGTINAEGGDLAPGIGTGVPANWSGVDSLSITGANVNVVAGKSAGAIHLETGDLHIDDSAHIIAFALDKPAFSQALRNTGNGRMVNGSFAVDELEGDFYIRSANGDVEFWLRYPYRHLAFTGLEPHYSLVGGYTQQSNLAIMDVTDPENPLNYVICDSDFVPRNLMVVGVLDGHMVEYRANGAQGIGPEDSSLYQIGETVTVMDQGGLHWSDLSFTGWNTQPDGNGTTYREGDSFVIEDTVILYSQWSGDSAITDVPLISFGKFALPNRDALYPALDADVWLTLVGSSGWRLSALLGGIDDSFGNHDAMPGASVVFKGGKVESGEGETSPWISPNFHIDAGGGAVVFARSASDGGMGTWTFRWTASEDSGISLFIPAGEGSVGVQSATITWMLEDVP